MTDSDTPPDGLDMTEDTGVYMTHDPNTLPPDVRRRVERRMREQKLVEHVERKITRLGWKMIAAALLPLIAALVLFGMYRERVDATQRAVERLEAKVDRVLEQQR